jgi:hypothetical protein
LATEFLPTTTKRQQQHQHLSLTSLTSPSQAKQTQRAAPTMSNAPGSGGLNNRFNSYQQSFGHNASGKIFAEEQTNTLKDTVTTQYQAEETANAVLTQLHGQRQQLQGANDDVWETRQLTEETKRELHALQAKYREKKNRLRIIIGLLGIVDFLLFVRLLRCGGSFFCRRY